ncbi:MAG: cytidine deaminase [Clostridiales bacterium]|nr:cytidine deaminase [Clostridiales bacterium]
MTPEALIEQARAMLPLAYAPYSGFPVGAALECADGTVYTGCNVENAAYGSSLCAERTALVKAVSEGRRSFTRLVVIGDTEDFCTPCGACRQMLYEFAPNLTVYMANRQGDYLTASLGELLPHGFGPAALGSEAMSSP